ncbi:conserved hypothetical protein [Synechococcus sp. PCC 7335]|nr:conserved hypothetical protein [Synechococcus sp. PCC 7335]
MVAKWYMADLSAVKQEPWSDPLNFRLGCAVWAFKDWVGSFYPAKSQPTNFLRLYGERMLGVEGNTTFYSVPSLEVVKRWSDNTPSGFRFCPKLPRQVTHAGPLVAHLPAAQSFLSLMQQGLGTRLGPIMIQLPPSYSPAAFNDLKNFLEALSKESTPVAVEVRHLDWFRPPFVDRLRVLLTTLNVGQVLLDSRMMYVHEDEGDIDPQMYSTRRKPKVPLQPQVTSDFAIVRYISHPHIVRNQGYLAEWVSKVDEWLSIGTQVYFFVHCPMEVESPRVARHFQTMLEAANVKVPPLPWMHLEQPLEQLRLF